MTMFVMISLLIGMVVGKRFKVLVLVPGIGLALIVTIMAGIARGDAFWPIVLMSAAVIASLQIGYLAGTGICQFAGAARASRLGVAFLGGSMAAWHPLH